MDLQARNALLAPGQTSHALLTVPARKKRRREEDGGGGGAGGSMLNAPEAAHTPAAEAAATNGDGLVPPAGGAAEAGAADGTTPSGVLSAPPQAKRMRLGPGDDVSSHVAPSLAESAPRSMPAAAAAEPAAAGAGAGAALSPTVPRRIDGPLPPSHYVLTLDQMQQHGYPLPELDEASGELVVPEGYVATRSRAAAQQRQQQESGAAESKSKQQQQQQQVGGAGGSQSESESKQQQHQQDGSYKHQAAVEGQVARAVDDAPELIAVDCEMCITAQASCSGGLRLSLPYAHAVAAAPPLPLSACTRQPAPHPARPARPAARALSSRARRLWTHRGGCLWMNWWYRTTPSLTTTLSTRARGVATIAPQKKDFLVCSIVPRQRRSLPLPRAPCPRPRPPAPAPQRHHRRDAGGRVHAD